MIPRVSVIIPTYNALTTLKYSLDSVFSQTYGNFEIICIDNGSEDQTLEYLENYPRNLSIKICNIPGSGPARNLGVKYATGKYVAFLDADDSWEPLKLTKQVELAESLQDSNLIIGTYAKYVGQNRKIIGSSPRSPNDIEATTNLRNTCTMPAPLSTWVMHKTLFENVGGFDPNFRFSQDLEFLLRAVNSGVKIMVIREPLCFYNLSYSSGSAKHYVLQNMTSQFLKLKQLSKIELSLEQFINQKRFKKIFYLRKAYAGKFFRKSIIDFGSDRYFLSSLNAIISLCFAPIIFLKKIINQSNLTWR